MKVIGNRVLLQVEIINKKDDAGNVRPDISREGKVLQSNSEEIKKGDVCYYNPYGCVEIESKRKKNMTVLCVDIEDIYIVL